MKIKEKLPINIASITNEKLQGFQNASRSINNMTMIISRLEECIKGISDKVPSLSVTYITKNTDEEGCSVDEYLMSIHNKQILELLLIDSKKCLGAAIKKLNKYTEYIIEPEPIKTE